MRKKLSAIIIALAVPLVLIPSAHADNQSMPTTSTIEFAGMPKVPSGPVDPNSPDKPMEQPNPDIVGNPDNKGQYNPGALRLIAVPNFNFGSYDLKDGPKMERTAIPDVNNKYKLYSVQISDTRPYTSDDNIFRPWVLKLTFEELKNDRTGSTLSNTSFAFKNPTITSTNQADPTKVFQDIDSSNPYVYYGGARLYAGQEWGIISALPGNGRGKLTTSINWRPQDIVLSAPVGNAISGDNYSTNMYWYLESVQ